MIEGEARESPAPWDAMKGTENRDRLLLWRNQQRTGFETQDVFLEDTAHVFLRGLTELLSPAGSSRPGLT